ncbi:MAG: 3-hydroxyacyl-ACP dehydratase [Bacteroidetes bacterium]|nr:3-hydroxyacyl-ACP dehydratase [Bacteroidota bacterium]
MIDELVACDEQSATTKLQVRNDNLFIKNGSLTEPALVENIAQTAAARIGYICHKENKAVPIGYIAAVQNLRIEGLPATGDTLETEITIKNQVLNVTIISGHTRVKDRLVASCEMKIFIS